MSSATLVVRQYETASELSEWFGCALIDLLREHRGLPGAGQLSAERKVEARATAAAFVLAVTRAQRGDWGDTPAHQNDVVLPDGFAMWLQATHQGDAVRETDLDRVTLHLTTEPGRLDDADLGVLEHLSRVLDAQATHLFHQLTGHAVKRG